MTKKRINLDLSDDCYRDLQILAAAAHKSHSNIIRDAIAFDAWFRHQQALGAKLMIQTADGKLIEVLRL